jgi:hypothetical protein
VILKLTGGGDRIQVGLEQFGAAAQAGIGPPAGRLDLHGQQLQSLSPLSFDEHQVGVGDGEVVTDEALTRFAHAADRADTVAQIPQPLPH